MAQRTYLQAIQDALREEMQADDRVFLLGQDIATYGGAFYLTQGFLDEFGPERVLDTPLSESAIIGAAIGAAIDGLRPVAEIQFIDFISCCFHLVTNWAAKAHYRWEVPIPMVIRGPAGGTLGAGPFHSQCVESYFTHTPGLKVVVPATPRDAKGLLKAAIRDPNPVLYLEQKALYRAISEDIPEGDYTTEIGEARIVTRGEDITVVSYGTMLHRCAEAVERLPDIAIELIDLRTLVPLDAETVLDSVKRTGKCVVVHEDTLTAGFGAEIVARIADEAFEYLDGPIKRVASLDTPVPYAKVLENAFLPQVEGIMDAIESLYRY
jgi:2-oxoisovalerate dehydrogenase E1 component beta subunit